MKNYVFPFLLVRKSQGRRIESRDTILALRNEIFQFQCRLVACSKLVKYYAYLPTSYLYHQQRFLRKDSERKQVHILIFFWNVYSINLQQNNKSLTEKEWRARHFQTSTFQNKLLFSKRLNQKASLRVFLFKLTHRQREREFICESIFLQRCPLNVSATTGFF